MTARHLSIACSLFSIAVAALAGEPKPPPPITVAITDQSIAGMEALTVLKGAYAAIGFELKAVELPPQRALLESSAGRVDGELLRATSIEEYYPDLRRVNVPFAHIRISALMTKDTPARTLDDMAKLPSVGILRGAKAMEDLTSQWSNVSRLVDYPAALQMLRIGRIRALIGPSAQTQHALLNSGFAPAEFVSREISSMIAYHYVHVSKAHLIPALAAELQRIKGKEATVIEGMHKHGQSK